MDAPMIRRLLLVALALACAGVARAVEPDSTCTAPASSFELIQRGIFDRHDCNMSYCHGDARQAGLDLRAGNSYASLVRSVDEADQPPDEPGGLNLVEPGRPKESLLWLALARKTLDLSNAEAPPMPMDGLPLSKDELEGIRLWILEGAPETGVVNHVADLIDPCPPPSEEDEYIADLPACTWKDPSLLLPNLVPDPPADIRVFVQNGGRRVEFTTRVANIGDGPLIIQAGTLPAGPGHTVDAMQVILRKDGSKCVHRAGTMRMSEGNRWQYGNFADFELRRDDPTAGPVLAYSSKAAYCLLDTDPIRASENRPRQYEEHCTDPIGRMGISVGYKDTYSRVHPAQWIDLDADPGVPIERGEYYLINVADPSNHFWEKDDKRDDNLNYTTLRLGLSDPDPPQLQPPGTTPTVRRRPAPARRTPRPNQRALIRVRPPRATRPPRPGSTIARPPVEPTPTVNDATRPEPTPTPRVNRGPRQLPTRDGRPARPTRAPRPGRPGTELPTPTPQPIAGLPDRCRHTCPYDSSQLRLTWYTALGLQFNGFINPGGAGCEPLHPEPGAEGTLYMVNWRNQPGVNLNFDRSVSFVLGEDQSGLTSDSGEMSFNQTTGGFRFQYESPVQPIANQASGFDGFPVVFDVCLVLGNETVTTRLVCQPKSRGMLCHEG